MTPLKRQLRLLVIKMFAACILTVVAAVLNGLIVTSSGANWIFVIPLGIGLGFLCAQSCHDSARQYEALLKKKRDEAIASLRLPPMNCEILLRSLGANAFKIEASWCDTDKKAVITFGGEGALKMPVVALFDICEQARENGEKLESIT